MHRLNRDVLVYCARGIVNYLNGDIEMFQEHIEKAMKQCLCICGNATIRCRYKRQRGRLCTKCGIVWINGKPERKCNARTA